MYELRKPQQIVFDKIKENLIKKHKKILVSAPTGFGKTILSYQICKDALFKNNRVLFTAHRIQLAEQTFEKFLSLKPELLQGENKLKDNKSMLIVATLQTLLNEEIPEPKIILIDEVHYAYESELVQSLFLRFPKSIFIGLSATPVDNKDFLLDGWDSIIDDYQTIDLQKLGWLTPFRCFAPVSIDLSNVRVSNNDFIEKELEKEINKDDINASIVENYISFGENRTFIAFASSESHCKDLKKHFYSKNIKVEIISSETSKIKRDKYLSELKNNLIQGLISIEILTAGFDEPKVSCVIFATATMQWKKYIQCAGRGIRLLGNSLEESIYNGKSDCIILDFCGNIERHGMPDDRKEFVFEKKISRVLDKEFNLSENQEVRNSNLSVISEEKQVFLKRIGSLLDLYDGKIYKNESELQEDVNSFLDKTGYFYWRQNSGKMFKDGRWVHFASKSGLPDNTVFYKNTSFFFGLELKMKYGKLTDNQKKTLPEMIQKKVLFFICESVYDVYKSIEHVENNIEFSENGYLIKKSIYELSDKQIEYRTRLNLQTIN